LRLNSGTVQQVKDFRWPAVDEFRTKLDGRMGNGVTSGKDSAADAIARLQNCDCHACVTEFGAGSQTRHARTDYDDIRIG
jgi:hypothetical protein